MGNFQGLFIQFSLALQVSYGLYCPSVCQCTREESMTHTVVDIDCRALNWTRSELPKVSWKPCDHYINWEFIEFGMEAVLSCLIGH